MIVPIRHRPKKVTVFSHGLHNSHHSLSYWASNFSCSVHILHCEVSLGRLPGRREGIRDPKGSGHDSIIETNDFQDSHLVVTWTGLP